MPFRAEREETHPVSRSGAMMSGSTMRTIFARMLMRLPVEIFDLFRVELQ
jgi:hypothetical protein